MTDLHRRLGMGGAVVTGLGSILGTGVFVSIAVAAGFAGRWILVAVPLAAVVATFNGLSSAQLAAAHPMSGGTYEYGYRFLGPWWGYVAGWLFVVAKTASASTAALGFAGYAGTALGLDQSWQTILALTAVAAVTLLVLSGIHRTARVNAILVALTIGALLVFVGAGSIAGDAVSHLTLGEEGRWWDQLLTGTAFLFVAYTGYGRIATLGEEVRDPATTIPRAVITTLGVSAALYTAVAVVGWRLAGPTWGWWEGGRAPLAGLLTTPWAQIVEIGAVVAMLGVLLNLVLGLSRVWLAMGRRNDMPEGLARVSAAGSPSTAVIVTGMFVAAVALIGDVRLTWSYSAFAVLLYYAITNWAALRLPSELRRFPRWLAVAGLASCLFLSFWVEPTVWIVGMSIIVIGLAWRAIRRRTLSEPSRSPTR